jgi:hypothetical protein
MRIASRIVTAIIGIVSELEDAQNPSRAKPDAEKQRKERGEFFPCISPVINIGIFLFPL